MKNEVAKSEKSAINIVISLKVFPIIIALFGIILMLCQWFIGLNIITIIGMIFMCVSSAIIFLGIIFKKKIFIEFLVGYLAVSFGIATFYIFNGADAGWGGILSAVKGFASAEHPLWQGDGNFFTRLIGNIIISAPVFLLIMALSLVCAKWKTNNKVLTKNILLNVLSIGLILASILQVFTLNLRANPKAFDLSKGHNDYLSKINNNAKDKKSPNVLFILMDDLGYGDTSYNAKKMGLNTVYDTPNMDWIAEDGIDFENCYSSYSVCSPSRFSALTGRYPYRGYADNVLYPTVNTFSPLASTRVFNSIELGGNTDGMLGDEITIAETLKSAGYSTGAFGKWHMGDYGQYLPTNQGFDYFYGSHHVNDMSPYYLVEEKNGNYTVDQSAKGFDQSLTTDLVHNQLSGWLNDVATNDEPFFAYYATPWPHYPVYAGNDYHGSSGAGIYGDCLKEFDDYLGKLFNQLEDLGVLDDTIIMFSSDNGPALQGSTNEIRGGKYTAYDGGQKVPFYMRWGKNADCVGGRTIKAPIALTDIFPTLAEMCNISGTVDGKEKNKFLPSDVDRQIDGVSITSLIKDYKNTVFVHDQKNPILHMKREKIKAVQYSLNRQDVLSSVKGYKKSPENQLANEIEYENMKFIKNNDYLTFKYFRKMNNDNPAFPDKVRKNWLICLTDDTSESYQRANLLPNLAKDYNDTLSEWTNKFKDNRRGVIEEYYAKKK